MKNTTLLRAFLAVLAGILSVPLIGCQNSSVINIVFILWLLISVIILINAHKNLFPEKIFCMLVIFGCVITGYIITLQPIKKYNLPDTCNAHVNGIVEQPVEWQKSSYNFNNKQDYYAVFKFKIYKAETNNICITHINELVRCTLVSSTPLNIRRGDLIDVSGVLKKFSRASNPGQFDTANYFAKKDIAYRFTARKGMIKWRNPPYMSAFLKLRRSLDNARKQLANKITGTPEYETEANVLSKMLLGTRGLLPEELTELLQRTNTFHIIAISGLHIGIVCGIWWCVMWLIGVPWKYRGAALLPVLWLYAIMVGLRASVVRASFMFTALAVAPLINRPHRAVQALLTAGLLYLLLWPREVTSFGTQLTFLSVVALLSMASLFALFFDRFAWVRGPAVYDLEHIHRRYFHNILHYFLQIVCATVAIWLITWPVVLTRSNLVTPLSWLANLCVVPALGVVLTLGFTSLVLSFVWPFIAELITYANLLFLHFLINIIEFVAKIPAAYFSARSLTVIEILCYYSALVITLLWLTAEIKIKQYKKRSLRIIGALACVIWIVFIVMITEHNNTGQLKLVTLDVGLGDASVIHLPSGETVLIDGGVRIGPWSMGSRVVVPYLRSVGINKLDAVILSHFDRDHIGGIVDVLKKVKVKCIYSPPQFSDNILSEELKQIVKKQKIPWHTLYAGDKLCWNAVTATVINPPGVITNWLDEAAKWGKNTWSVVTRWEWKDCSFITTGDATIASEAFQIKNNYKLKSNVLKVGHHGSLSSSSEKYLKSVSPFLSLVSVGQNTFGLPSREVMDKLGKFSPCVVRTDERGAIMITFHPSAMEVEYFGSR